MQRLSNPRNKDNNSHVENMQRLFNEKEDKQNLRNNERKLNGQKHEENMS